MLFHCHVIDGDLCYLFVTIKFYKKNYVNTIRTKILAKNKNNKLGSLPGTYYGEWILNEGENK